MSTRFTPCQLVWQVDQFDWLKNGHRVNALSSPTRRLPRRVGEEREWGEACGLSLSNSGSCQTSWQGAKRAKASVSPKSMMVRKNPIGIKKVPRDVQRGTRGENANCGNANLLGQLTAIQCGLGRGQTGNGDTKRRTADVVKSDCMAELDRSWIATVFTTDTTL